MSTEENEAINTILGYPEGDAMENVRHYKAYAVNTIAGLQRDNEAAVRAVEKISTADKRSNLGLEMNTDKKTKL